MGGNAHSLIGRAGRGPRRVAARAPCAGGQTESGALDCRLIDQHDGDIVLYRVHAVALRALQGLWTRTVFQWLLAGWADKNLQ